VRRQRTRSRTPGQLHTRYCPNFAAYDRARPLAAYKYKGFLSTKPVSDHALSRSGADRAQGRRSASGCRIGDRAAAPHHCGRSRRSVPETRASRGHGRVPFLRHPPAPPRSGPGRVLWSTSASAIVNGDLTAVSAHLLFPPSATVLCSARRG
jgi:hypothetical protein